jgi:uncharacterized membrane protein
MPDRLGEILPDRPSHRLLVAYALAITGILAVGDGLNVVQFPMYQLGLPDTTLANAVVALGGVAVFVGAYRLAMDTVDESSDADGDTDEYGEHDPVQIVKERYARGELSDEEFQRKLDRLEDSDDVAFDPDDKQTLIEETGISDDSGLVDRQTTID